MMIQQEWAYDSLWYVKWIFEKNVLDFLNEFKMCRMVLDLQK